MSFHCQYRTAVPSVQLLMPCLSIWSFPEPLFVSLGPVQLQPVSPDSSACLRVLRSPSESFGSDIQSLSCIFIELSPFPVFYFYISMVRTRGGSRLRPRVRFSSPEREAPAPVPSPVLEVVSEEPQGFRRYQTWMGPQAPSPVP